MKDKLVMIAWFPMLISYGLIPFLMLIGGRDLGAYGTNSAIMDALVTLMWVFIPLGLIISILSSLLILITGIISHHFHRIREAVFLFLCCILFPLLFLLLNGMCFPPHQ